MKGTFQCSCFVLILTHSHKSRQFRGVMGYFILLSCVVCFPNQVCVSIQESELIDRGDDEGIDDSAHSPVPEDKPKIQVSQHFHCVLQNY